MSVVDFAAVLRHKEKAHRFLDGPAEFDFSRLAALKSSRKGEVIL